MKSYLSCRFCAGDDADGSSDEAAGLGFPPVEACGQGASAALGGGGSSSRLQGLLALPRIPTKRPRKKYQDPIIDYSKSLLLTSEDYLNAMQEKAEKREAVRREAEQRRTEMQRRRFERQAEKERRDAERAQRRADKEAMAAFRKKWTPQAISAAGEQLQHLLKNPPPLTSTDYRAPFCGVLPPICKRNMALRLEKQRAKKGRSYDANAVNSVCVPPPWVHQCDTRFQVEGEVSIAERFNLEPAHCGSRRRAT